MSSGNSQKFIKRNRPPRVHISYQDPYNSEKLIELPFVMGVMADLSGNASKVEKPRVGERKFLEFDMDNFNKRMSAIEPGASFRVENKLSEEPGTKLGVALTFKAIEDFEPEAVAKQIPELNKLLEARNALANLKRYMDGRVSAEERLKELLSDPDLMASLRERRATPPPADGDE